MKKVTLLIFIFISFMSCVSIENPGKRRNEYISLHPELTEKRKTQILEGTVSMGMTTEEVRASRGEPRDINRTTLKTGTHEQWVYGSIEDREYFYFENGKVIGWQD